MIIFTNKTYEVIQDPDAFWVFNKSLCLRASNGELTCFPNLDTIQKDTKFGRNKVIKCLDYLEKVGVIRIQAQIIDRETKQIIQKPRGYQIPKGESKYESTSNLYTIIAEKEIVSIAGKLKEETPVPKSNCPQFQNDRGVGVKTELTPVPKSNSNLQVQDNLQVNITLEKNIKKENSNIENKFNYEKWVSENYKNPEIIEKYLKYLKIRPGLKCKNDKEILEKHRREFEKIGDTNKISELLDLAYERGWKGLSEEYLPKDKGKQSAYITN